MGEITWHFQQMPGWAPQDVANSRVQYAKIINPPEQNPLPSTRVIGRTFMPDDESNALIARGRAGADQWWDRWRAYYAARPWVWAWEAPNEPQPMADPNFVEALDEFTLRLVELYSAAGLRLVGLNLGVGWPRLEYWNDPPPHPAALRNCCLALRDNGHVLGLHEYSAPAMWDRQGAHCLRHAHTLLELDVPSLPIAITECGIDGGVAPVHRPRTGWRTYCTPTPDSTPVQQYIEQLQWYRSVLHPDVLTATVFTAGPYGEWTDFEITRELSLALVDLAGNSPPPPEPPPEPPPPPLPEINTKLDDIQASTSSIRSTLPDTPTPPPPPPTTYPRPAWLPEQVSGRTVTRRGVHLHPHGQHSHWIQRHDYWINLLHEMDMSWVVAVIDSDNLTIPRPILGDRSVAQLLLDEGIIPICRIQCTLPYPYPHVAHVEELARQFAEYGLKPILTAGNEPGNPREWRNHQVPPDWFEFYVGDWFPRTAQAIINAGGVAGFADGPSLPADPFPLMEDTWPLWESHDIIYTAHPYGLNRRHDYPYCQVVQATSPDQVPLLTDSDLQDWFGPHYDDPGLNDTPLGTINNERILGRQPGLTALDDDVCWRGWERIASWMEQHFGHPLCIAMTEGGWTPGARAGIGPDADLRWPRPTPVQVADWTATILSDTGAPHPMFAQCPWLLADGDMAGYDVGWPYDAWVGWAYERIYGREKPVIAALRGA